MNKIIQIGRISQDPEVRITQEGNAVVRFNFAVARTYKRDGEPDADFFPCIIFGKTAERFYKLNVSKGTKLMIEGELRNNNYTDRNGVKRYENQIVVQNFEFCESKGQTYTPQTPKTASNEGFMPIPDEVYDDSLPFH